MEEVKYTRVADLKRLNFITRAVSAVSKTDGIILDVGCGNGLMSQALGKLGYRVTGIDMSAKAIESARAANHLENVEFHVKSAEELQKEEMQYDAIICSEVLEHLDRPIDLLQVLFTLLKDDGTLVVTVPNGMGPREVLVTKPMQKLKRDNKKLWNVISKGKRVMGYSGKTVQSDSDDLTHIHFFTRKDLSHMARETKFEIVQFEKADFIEDVFPISLLTKRSTFLQKLDCKAADILPYQLTGGFYTVWKKSPAARKAE